VAAQLRFAALFLFAFSTLAQQPVVSYSRFCATCGIWGAETIVSQSGQFIVHGSGAPSFPPVEALPRPIPIFEMEPQLVAVTAERTKRAFLEELRLGDNFRDKVHIVLLTRASPDQGIGFVTHVHSDGFQYQIGLPGYLESGRMIKAIVQALLTEFANRPAHRNVELPTWLVEGMTRQLLSSVVPSPVVNRKPLTVERLGFDRLSLTRAVLQTNSPMTMQELSFSNLQAFNPAERLRYESCAHLLVYELLRLRGGTGLMARFLQALPQALNWQTAFFGVYHQYFQTPLDLEKWWMLCWMDVRNREDRQTFPTAVSLQRLEALLLTGTELRLNTNSIPHQHEATLQELLYATDFGVQKQLLGKKLQEIFFLSLSLSPEVMPIANGYQQTLETYLQKRSLNDYQPALKSDPEQRLQFLLKSTIKSLERLDRAREDLRAGRKPKLPETGRRG